MIDGADRGLELVVVAQRQVGGELCPNAKGAYLTLSRSTSMVEAYPERVTAWSTGGDSSTLRSTEGVVPCLACSSVMVC